MAAISQGAAAQEAAPADERAEAEFVGNEIVVTATKREQTLQDVPVAVSVTTAATIERAQIRDISDLASVVPSLRVGQRQDTSNTNFFIRGFGNGANNAGIEPSVGVFIDGVYRSRSAAQVADFPDVARVEVLRGPQSTLFGKNASAGVISIVTQAPKFEFGGNAELSYGNYNAIVAKAVMTGPLTDTLAFSLSGGINRRDGYYRNLGTGNRINDRDRWFLRAQALYQPDDRLSVRVIADYGKITEACCAVVAARVGPATGVLTSPLVGGRVNDPARKYGSVVYTNYDPASRIENYGISGQIDYDFDGAKLTSTTAWRESKSSSDFDSDFTSADLVRGANIGFVDIDTFTQELRLTTTLREKVDLLLGGFYLHEKVKQGTTLRWGTAARPYFDALVRASSGNTQNLPALEGLFGTLSGNPGLYTGRFFAAGQGFDEDDRLDNDNYSLFAQADVHVTDRLTLTGGINYTNDKKRFALDFASSDVFGGLNLPALRAAATSAGIAQAVGGLIGAQGGFATPAQVAAFAAQNPGPFAQIQTAAGNATLPLLGLRSLQIFGPALNVPNAVEPGRTADDKITYTLRAAYDVSDNLNVYVSYATGYKASSIALSRDSRPFLADRAAIEAGGIGVVNQSYGTRYARPESSTVYEAGFKGDWDIATANVAVFHQAIKGFQSNIFTGLGFVLGNAGKQSVRGFEFDGTLRPLPPLTLALSVTYLDPKYDDFKQSAFGDATGIRPADIPAWSVTVGGEYDHDFGNGDHAILRASYHFESDLQTIEGLPAFIQRNPVTGEVLPGGYQPGLDAARAYRRQVDELDASLTYAMDSGFEVTVWGRNLLNDRFINQVFDSPAQNGSVSAYINQPRTYGIAARYRW